jgi:hypothetical protein
MELRDTIDNMVSFDYKKRFKAEYDQLETRVNKLASTIELAKKDELPFELACPVSMLEEQLEAMEDYLEILTERAEIEDIKI